MSFAIDNKLLSIKYFSREELLSEDIYTLIYQNKRFINFKEFNKYYKGISYKLPDGKGITIFLTDEELQDLPNQVTLVDGNAKRFANNSDYIDIDIPKSVIDAIAHYTGRLNAKLDPKATEWLLNNFKVSYNEITLYRGSSIEAVDMEDLEKNLFRYYGLRHLEDLKIGASITIKRNKESSWSKSPVVAQNFVKFSNYSIGIIVKATVPANRVLFDFNLLPNSFYTDKSNKFKFFAQAEVLLTKGPIDCTITNLSIKDYNNVVTDLLTDNGYRFKANYGFSKI